MYHYSGSFPVLGGVVVGAGGVLSPDHGDKHIAAPAPPGGQEVYEVGGG